MPAIAVGTARIAAQAASWRVKHVGDTVLEQPGRLFYLLAQPGMRPLRSMANADDESIADKDRGLAIADFAVGEMGRARRHEQLVAINVQLWQLVRGARPRSPAGASRNSPGVGAIPPRSTRTVRSRRIRT